MKDPWDDPGIQWLAKVVAMLFLGAVGCAALAMVGIAKGIHWLAIVSVILEMPLSMLTANAGTVLVYQKREIKNEREALRSAIKGRIQDLRTGPQFCGSTCWSATAIQELTQVLSWLEHVEDLPVDPEVHDRPKARGHQS